MKKVKRTLRLIWMWFGMTIWIPFSDQRNWFSGKDFKANTRICLMSLKISSNCCQSPGCSYFEILQKPHFATSPCFMTFGVEPYSMAACFYPRILINGSIIP